MNWKHLLYAIPLCLVLGFIFGFYINIPKHITIDTGDNLKELSKSMENISLNFNNACHNLTFTWLINQNVTVRDSLIDDACQRGCNYFANGLDLKGFPVELTNGNKYGISDCFDECWDYSKTISALDAQGINVG